MFPGKSISSIAMASLLLLSALLVMASGIQDEEPFVSTPTRTIIEETESNNAWSSANSIPSTSGTSYELHGNLSSSSDFDYYSFTLNGGAGPVDQISITPLWVDTDYQDQTFVAWIWSFYPDNSFPPTANSEISSVVGIWTEMYYFWTTLSFTACYSGNYGMIIRPASTLDGALSYNLSVSINSVSPNDPNNDRGSSMELSSLKNTIGGSLVTNSDQFDTFHFSAPNPIHPTTLDLTLSLSSNSPSRNDGIYDWGVEIDVYIYHDSRSSPGSFANPIVYRVSPETNFQARGCLAPPAKISLSKNCTEMYVTMFIRTFGLDINGNRQYSPDIGRSNYNAIFNIIPEIPNNKPILKDPTVNMLKGRSTDMFEFRVDYFDANNDTPEQVWLWNDGEQFREMSPIFGSGTDHTVGVTYGVDIPGSILGKDAEHIINISASDGKDWALHSLVALDSFTVIVDDNLPPASEGTVPVIIEEDSETHELDLDSFVSDPNPTTQFKFAILAPNGEWDQSYRDDNLSAYIKPPQVEGESNLLLITPKANKYGSFVLTVNATDDGVFPKYVELDILLEVEQVNDPPVIKRIGTKSVDEQDTYISFQKDQDEKVTLNMIAEDIDDGDILTFDWNIEDILNDPVPGLNYFINRSSGEMWFIPGDNDIPEVDLIVSVNDGNGGKAEMSVIVEVSNVNDPPTIIVPETKSTIEDEYLYINPVAVDPDLDSGDQLFFGYELGSLALAAPPNAIDFDIATGRLVLKAITEEMNGEWEITITVSDSSLLSDSGVCTITIQNVNDVPEAENVYYDATDGDLNVYFNTAEASDEDGDDLTYIWDFGDGTPIVQGIDMNRVEHTYADGGSYTATMKIFDGEAYSEEITVLISVVAPEPDPDQDGDGIDDSWEIRYGLDPTDPDDALLDPDNDGLTNLDEFNYNKDFNWDLNPHNPDTDEDGWKDGKEVEMSFDPMDPGDHPDSKYSGIPLLLYIGVILVMVLAVLFIFVFLVMKKRNKPQAVASMAPILPAMDYPAMPQAEMGYQEIPPVEYENLPPAQMEYIDQNTGQYVGQVPDTNDVPYQDTQMVDPYTQDPAVQYPEQPVEQPSAGQEQWQQPPVDIYSDVPPAEAGMTDEIGVPAFVPTEQGDSQNIYQEPEAEVPVSPDVGSGEIPADGPESPPTEIQIPQEEKKTLKDLPPPPDIPDL